ncbi:MAG: hypothetical protein AB9873_02260 [Syntrophobacteraceae bacterium]
MVGRSAAESRPEAAYAAFARLWNGGVTVSKLFIGGLFWDGRVVTSPSRRRSRSSILWKWQQEHGGRGGEGGCPNYVTAFKALRLDIEDRSVNRYTRP